ncbi:hypothetical protein VIBNIAM115_450004 [Vibrio nigripulchritudo AM115]|nr:hypothetical protein VIBNIAM115_450004 [Vibrio nigripulchritudo AM115]
MTILTRLTLLHASAQFALVCRLNLLLSPSGTVWMPKLNFSFNENFPKFYFTRQTPVLRLLWPDGIKNTKLESELYAQRVFL